MEYSVMLSVKKGLDLQAWAAADLPGEVDPALPKWSEQPTSPRGSRPFDGRRVDLALFLVNPLKPPLVTPPPRSLGSERVGAYRWALRRLLVALFCSRSFERMVDSPELGLPPLSWWPPGLELSDSYDPDKIFHPAWGSRPFLGSSFVLAPFDLHGCNG
ncbi:hypothetical protein CISG_00720 [Coccidioides immitis RMSCC 3703]|uniref:Uncharacterized protein n=1 Tax=Coccidioides immitis RMSCC 3703 TaxID=454286 RepID=A0A0J8QRS0_COCIT|nr:hypothetical protein CISG_00720 [Coccidioides immitis RMSCC 3703]